MSKVAAVIALIACLAIVGFTFVIGNSINEAQRIGVERQQSCVEQGGSFIDLAEKGQICLKNSELVQ